MTTDTLDAARRYVAAGLSVIPLLHGSKQPDHRLLEVTTGLKDMWCASDSRAPWRVYCNRLPTDAELVTWFGDSAAGIGIVGGAISGGLVRIDFEHPSCLLTWQQELGRINPALPQIAATLPIVETIKGHHVYFRMPDPPGYTLLSSHGEGNDLLVLAETQGEGCYCVAPPSSAYRADGTLFQYRWFALLFWSDAPHLSSANFPTLNQEIATTLLDMARFAAFWKHPLGEPFNTRVRAARQGLLLEQQGSGWSKDWYIGWDDLGKLRTYLDRYEALLKAIETAPPPPPSYSHDEEDYEDDDE